MEPFVVIHELPPSSNKIYVNKRGGGRFMTKEAASFKTRMITQIQVSSMVKIMQLDRGLIYQVWYAFFFPKDELLNISFGSGKKDAAKTRYKRMDVENRLKLVSDALATAIGIDDCQFFEGGHSKMCDSLVGGQPQVQIFLTPMDPRRVGLES